MKAYKNFRGSLSTLWYGGNYTNLKADWLHGNRVVITGKKRFSNDIYGKVVTRKYAERILPSNLTF